MTAALPSSVAFPVASSVLDPGALATYVLPAYGIRGARCRFAKRGPNDTYAVVDADGTRYLRVYRAGWRTRAQIEAELDLLCALRDRGAAVAAPVPRRDGGLFTTLRAPEGIRYATLMTEAPGVPAPTDPDACHVLGSVLGALHVELDALAPDPRRFDLDEGHLLREPVARVAALLPHRRDLVDALAAVADDLARVIARVDRTGPRWGACHGDFHPGNVHVDLADGGLSVFDFDCFGYGWRAYDLAVFRWHQMLQHPQDAPGTARAERQWNAFVAGYAGERAVDDAERAAVDVFVAARHVWSLGLYAGGETAWGGGWLTDDYFENQIGFVAKLCAGLPAA